MIKPALAVFLSLVLAIALGIATMALLGARGDSGRDFSPLVSCSLAYLALGGFAYRRWFHRGEAGTWLGLAVFAVLLAWAVGSIEGGDAPSPDWYVFALALTVGPWFAGFGIGHWTRHLRMTA
jgi:hypothetical protein